jgi:probable phosphomutase (TIGR03848 family)
MATVILVRHGRTTANATGMLAGRTAGVKLDDTGKAQAARAGERLAGVALTLVVTSPLERCRQTSRALLEAHPTPVELVLERGVIECDYGEWQGRSLRDLAKEKLWSTVQTQPSAAVFPGGESMSGMQARAVNAVRRVDALLEERHGPGAIGVVVSHGDIIKSILADALGMHLDLFQRIQVDPASISVVRYTGTRPYVLASNTHAGDLSYLNPPPPKRGARGRRSKKAEDAAVDDAAVGGGSGPASVQP